MKTWAKSSTWAQFSVAVAEKRHAKGWTQQELADAVGVGRAQIANIEAGRVGTTIGGLVAFADALGCSTDSLLRRGRGRRKRNGS